MLRNKQTKRIVNVGNPVKNAALFNCHSSSSASTSANDTIQSRIAKLVASKAAASVTTFINAKEG